MEPNNYGQGGAASSNPAVDLQALLHAVRRGDPSSSQLQQHHHAASSSLLYHPQQALPRPPQHMFPNNYGQGGAASSNPGANHQAILHAVWLGDPSSSQLQLLPHQLRDASTGWHQLLSPAGAYNPSSMYASPFGMNPPSFNAPNAPPPRLWNGSGSLDPYTRALPRARRADADPPPLTREEVRARLLSGSREQALVMSAASSAHVIGLLAEGDVTVRRRVMACVKPIVHKVMSHSYPLFLALLHACRGRVNELKNIIGAMCNGKGFLMRFDDQDHKGEALKEVIRMVPCNRSLCKTLIEGLLHKERLMEDPQGPVVLRYCFTMLPYQDCSMIFEYTIGAIDGILSSQFGWICVVVCLENARNGELEALEATILTRISTIAKDRWSSDFLKHVLGHGSEQFKARIVERVAEYIVELTVDRVGSRVVEACFLSTGSRAALQSVLEAFVKLSDDDLAVLVQGWCSNYVIQNVLAAGKDHVPLGATFLARRIRALPEVVRKHRIAIHVTRRIKNLFPAPPIQ